MFLLVIMKEFGNMNENVIFKPTSCYQHMHKSYEIFSLQVFVGVNFTVPYYKVKLSFYTIFSISQPHPTKSFHYRILGF